MGLFPYQEDIVDRIRDSELFSLAAPRQNGKTFAALTAAVRSRMRVLYITSGFSSARHAYEMAEQIASDEERRVSASTQSNSKIEVRFTDGGSITFLSYNKNGARGYHAADMLILDDAEFADPSHLANLVPALALSERKTRIVSISVTPTDGIAKHLWDKSYDRVQYSGEDVEDANPALGHLLNSKAIEFERMCLPVECFRRERLGLVP